MMRDEFHEGYDSPSKDPLDGDTGHSTTQFDWDALFRRMGEGENPLGRRDYAAMVQVLRRLFSWCLELPRDGMGGRSTTKIGRRLLALVWTVSPDLLNCSQRQMAKQYGLLRQILQRHTTAARKTFGVRNRYQAHAWNYGKTKAKAQAAPKRRQRRSKAIRRAHARPQGG